MIYQGSWGRCAKRRSSPRAPSMREVALATKRSHDHSSSNSSAAPSNQMIAIIISTESSLNNFFSCLVIDLQNSGTLYHSPKLELI